MCALSMIMDYYSDKWDNKYPSTFEGFRVTPDPNEIRIEKEDFEKLAKIAKEYDVKTHQADCEMEEKKNKLEKIASELGIKLNL